MSIKRTNSKGDRYGGSRSKSGGTSANAKTKKKEITWQEAMADKSETSFVAYAQAGHFVLGNLIDHPRFGKGIVLSVEDHKMEVLFEDSKKLLVMDNHLIAV